MPVPLVTLCDPLWLPGVGLAHLIGSGVQRPSQPAHVHTSPNLLPIGAMLLVLPAWNTAACYHVANLPTAVEMVALVVFVVVFVVMEMVVVCWTHGTAASNLVLGQESGGVTEQQAALLQFALKW